MKFVNDGMASGADAFGQPASFEGFCASLGLGEELINYMISRRTNFGTEGWA